MGKRVGSVDVQTQPHVTGKCHMNGHTVLSHLEAGKLSFRSLCQSVIGCRLPLSVEPFPLDVTATRG